MFPIFCQTTTELLQQMTRDLDLKMDTLKAKERKMLDLGEEILRKEQESLVFTKEVNDKLDLVLSRVDSSSNNNNNEWNE